MFIIFCNFEYKMGWVKQMTERNMYFLMGIFVWIGYVYNIFVGICMNIKKELIELWKWNSWWEHITRLIIGLTALTQFIIWVTVSTKTSEWEKTFAALLALLCIMRWIWQPYNTGKKEDKKLAKISALAWISGTVSALIKR